MKTFSPDSGRGRGRGKCVPRGAGAPARTTFPELLAPAGSVESYFAAVSAGADAVYLGLQRFNARERAENFTLADLSRILPHARKRGVRVYVAMNTVLTEADLPAAVSMVHQMVPRALDFWFCRAERRLSFPSAFSPSSSSFQSWYRWDSPPSRSRDGCGARS